jgi:hypothetical protein
MNATTARAFSDKGNTTLSGQIAKANELLAEVALVNLEYAQQVWAELKATWKTNTCTAALVSSRISEMIDAKRAATRLAQGDVRVPSVADGRYAVTGDDGATKFYRVVSKEGRTTLFIYASDQQHIIGNWRTALGILRQIETDTEPVAALRFGRELGRCYRCGRTLTDQASRERGLGPDCSQRVS